jgi:hypothetical protein
MSIDPDRKIPLEERDWPPVKSPPPPPPPAPTPPQVPKR